MDPKPLPYSELNGISKKTLEIHHDKLYVGYVKKVDELAGKFKDIIQRILADETDGNATYSDIRNLKAAETFAINGVYLHEWYFDVLGGAGNAAEAPELSKALIEKWGSIENTIKYVSVCAMAARGWSVLCWDAKAGRVKHYNSDAHDQGGVWGCIPLITLDCYEHAYFIDYGSDKKQYIEAFWKNLNWKVAEELYLKAKTLTL